MSGSISRATGTKDVEMTDQQGKRGREMSKYQILDNSKKLVVGEAVELSRDNVIKVKDTMEL